MNILLMSRIIGRTGVGNHVKQLCEELVKEGHCVCVVSSTNDLDIGKDGGVLFERVELRSKNPATIIKSLKQINRIIEDQHIEIVHCHHRMAALFMHWYNLIWSIPYVYTLHLAPIPCDPIHRLMTFYGDRAIAISKEVGDFLNSKLKVPKNKISYVLNGVNEELLRPVTAEEKQLLRRRFNIPMENIVIALHSRIDEVKNHLDVVKAVSVLTEQEKERLTVICSGEKRGNYYERVCEAIQEHGLEQQFVFCGWVQARDILGCADALLLPSKSEGFPLNCIEAMFMEIPVTRSKTAGYEDMKEYLVGLEEISPETIAEHIRRIISGTENKNDQVKKAREFVRKTCTIEAMTRNTVSVYQQVLIEKAKIR